MYEWPFLEKTEPRGKNLFIAMLKHLPAAALPDTSKTRVLDCCCGYAPLRRWLDYAYTGFDHNTECINHLNSFNFKNERWYLDSLETFNLDIEIDMLVALGLSSNTKAYEPQNEVEHYKRLVAKYKPRHVVFETAVEAIHGTFSDIELFPEYDSYRFSYDAELKKHGERVVKLYVK